MDDDLPTDRRTVRLNLHIGSLDVKVDTTPACSLVYQKAGLRLEDSRDVKF